MRVLFIHQNFPGQFRHAAQAWAGRPGWQILALARDAAPGLPDVRSIRYKPHRMPHRTQHPYLRTMENAVLHGQAVARVLQQLKANGFEPDVVIAHPGWGETLYLREVFPRTRLVHYCEWYYTSEGADLGFDPEFPVTLDDRLRVQTWNAVHLLNLQNCDAGITPTLWQHSRHPAAYRGKIAVAHEGIDVEQLGADPSAVFTVPSGSGKGQVLRAGDPVITYVARNLEPYRGFHQFMRALQRVQAAHATCHAVIVGGDGVSYGRKPPDAPNWRERMLREVQIDPSRTHFVGKLPYPQYRRVLQVSAAHVYLTVPFVLSWSMLEAMASGCLVIASDTPPVTEVARDLHNAIVVPYFDPDAIAAGVLSALERPVSWQSLRAAARADVASGFALDRGLQALERLVAEGTNPRNAERQPLDRLTAAL